MNNILLNPRYIITTLLAIGGTGLLLFGLYDDNNNDNNDNNNNDNNNNDNIHLYYDEKELFNEVANVSDDESSYSEEHDDNKIINIIKNKNKNKNKNKTKSQGISSSINKKSLQKTRRKY